MEILKLKSSKKYQPNWLVIGKIDKRVEGVVYQYLVYGFFLEDANNQIVARPSELNLKIRCLFTSKGELDDWIKANHINILDKYCDTKFLPLGFDPIAIYGS